MAKDKEKFLLIVQQNLETFSFLPLVEDSINSLHKGNDLDILFYGMGYFRPIFFPAGIQNLAQAINTQRAKRLAYYLVNDKGDLEREKLDKIIDYIGQHVASLGHIAEYDSFCKEHMLKQLCMLRENNQYSKLLFSVKSPHNNPIMGHIIKETVGLPLKTNITDIDTRRALLSACLTPIRQNVGSCFASAPAIHIQEEQPILLIQDLIELINRGFLSKVVNGVDFTAPLSTSYGIGDLVISGEVRTQWQNVHEKLNGQKQVGSNSTSGLSNNLFDVEVNLYFDYRADKTWASIKLEFDNAMGRETGQVNQIALERAYMGYHLFDDGISRLDVMVGRQRMYDIYDSEVQYNSTADGFTGSYAVSFESVGDFVVKGGGYINDATQSHAVWVVEAGLFDIFDTGIYLEYSWIDWSKQGSIFHDNPKYKFINNQFILGYVFNPELMHMDARIFAGFLWNANGDRGLAKKLSNGKSDSKQNLAWWVAFQLGKLEKANDWAFQAQWQGVQVQSIPDYDVSGIGRGNSVGSSLYTNLSTSQLAAGNANYDGFELDLMYALTNEVVLEVRFQRAWAANSDFGGTLSYTNLQVEAIYGF